MIRVVFDTNILISAFLFSGKPEQLFELARSRTFHLLTSSSILAEFANCLRTKFDWEDEDITDAIRTVGYSAELVRPTAEIDILSNGADNRILDCAIAGKADYIVSGDRHLLELKTFKNVRILRAAELIKIISKEDM
ncbi:MAG: putative toxin-antitoxin system toxin component, PIN family [Candidatus Aminicenantes bacterium]|nr:putative toxin-antitoxin system toxin component, PIN family [Candidatus Aminicenantes bacterium]